MIESLDLSKLTNEEIDAMYAEMASDPEVQALYLQIEKEFEHADWEALLLGEAELQKQASRRRRAPRRIRAAGP